MRKTFVNSSWMNKNSAVMEKSKYLMVKIRGIFRTQSNICDGGFS